MIYSFLQSISFTLSVSAAGGASEIAAFSNFLNVGSLVGGH